MSWRLLQSSGGKFKLGHDATSKGLTSRHFRGCYHVIFIIFQLTSSHKIGRISLKNGPILKSKRVPETGEQASKVYQLYSQLFDFFQGKSCAGVWAWISWNSCMMGVGSSRFEVSIGSLLDLMVGLQFSVAYQISIRIVKRGKAHLRWILHLGCGVSCEA